MTDPSINSNFLSEKDSFTFFILNQQKQKFKKTQRKILKRIVIVALNPQNMMIMTIKRKIHQKGYKALSTQEHQCLPKLSNWALIPPNLYLYSTLKKNLFLSSWLKHISITKMERFRRKTHVCPEVSIRPKMNFMEPYTSVAQFWGPQVITVQRIT